MDVEYLQSALLAGHCQAFVECRADNREREKYSIKVTVPFDRPKVGQNDYDAMRREVLWTCQKSTQETLRVHVSSA